MKIMIVTFLFLLSSVAFAENNRGRFASITTTPIQGGFELVAEVINREQSDTIIFSMSAPVLVENPKFGGPFGVNFRFFEIYHHDGRIHLVPGTEVQEGNTFIKRIDSNRFQFRRKFTYAELNAELQKMSPEFFVGPGSNLFLEGEWTGGSQHVTGLAARGGGFLTPADQSSSGDSLAPTGSNASLASPLTLDHALEIDQPMIELFGQGLKLGGQVHSRLESEGKFQVGIRELPYLINRLFSLSANVNPVGLENIKGLGPDWELRLMKQYLVKGENGEPKLINGLPAMHPMVDTYYDHPEYLAAMTDMAVRYRFTEHNGIGNWNIKPGGGVLHTNSDGALSGIVDRVEYGLDVTNGHASSIATFADSQHVANPFRIVRTELARQLPQFGDVEPSTLLEPSLKLTTYRYKFLLVNKVTGLEIEISVDDVWAQALRPGPNRMVRFAQVEMDIEHVAAVVNSAAQNLVTSESGALTQRWNGTGSSTSSSMTLADGSVINFSSSWRSRFNFLETNYPLSIGYKWSMANPAGAKVETPSLHTIDSLSNNSPLRRAVATTLGPAAEAIEAFRNLLMDLTPYTIAPPKAALASALLYGHRPSNGVKSIQYEIDNQSSFMFDRNLNREQPAPNVFSCGMMLEAR